MVHSSDTLSILSLRDRPRLGILGAGVMGRALVDGMLKRDLLSADNIWVTARSDVTCRKASDSLGVQAVRDYSSLLPNTGIILLCVKPQHVGRALHTLREKGLSADTLVISIAAGVTMAHIEQGLGVPNAAIPVVRAMTNTPCQVSQGMTVICGGTHASSHHLATAQQIFESVGQCLEMDESYFDAVTGLCGSGPAYLYLIMEALADGGVRVGLPRDKALRLVAQTVLGAASMLQVTGRHPAALRDDVTTPAGCTIGALLTLEDGKIRSVLARAVEEATRIAAGLGQLGG